VRTILDTNVLVSGIFFSGPPSRILTAWNQGALTLVASLEILEEYRRVSQELKRKFRDVDIDAIIDLVVVSAEIYQPHQLPSPVCDDPDDDKFIACAVSANVGIVVSGDRHLLQVSGYQGIQVMKPREFVDTFLK
jgi:putative PIN family toxin of toxin-antitoxin system